MSNTDPRKEPWTEHPAAPDVNELWSRLAKETDARVSAEFRLAQAMAHLRAVLPLCYSRDGCRGCRGCGNLLIGGPHAGCPVAAAEAFKEGIPCQPGSS